MKQKKITQNQNVSSSFNLLDTKRQNQQSLPLNIASVDVQESLSNKENDNETSLYVKKKQFLYLEPNTVTSAVPNILSSDQRKKHEAMLMKRNQKSDIILPLSRKVISVQNESLIQSKKELKTVVDRKKVQDIANGKNLLNANQFIDFKVMENFLSFDQEKRKNYSVVSADGEAIDLNH